MNNRKSLIKAATDQIKNKFEEIRGIHFNPNTKGYNYEKTCKEFFKAYIGSLYDFYTRASVVDYEEKYNKVFKSGENEFDIIATYKTAIPKIVLKVGSGKFIPLDAVASVCEIKQTLTKSFLDTDLRKFKKFSSLPVSKNRMGTMGFRSRVRKGDDWGKRFTKEGVPIPKILIYYESVINQRSLHNMLIDYNDYWDAVVLVKDDRLILNRDSVLNFLFEGDQLIPIPENSLLWLLLLVTISLPVPNRVLTVDFFIKSLSSRSEDRK